MNVAQETLGFRRAGLSPALSLLMSAFALPMPPAALSSHLHRPTERSPTVAHLIQTSCRRGPAFGRIRLDSSGDALVSAAPEGALARPFIADSTSRGMLWSRPRLKALNLRASAQVSLAQACRFDKRFESDVQPAISVSSLSPVTSSAQDDSNSELLRFL